MTWVLLYLGIGVGFVVYGAVRHGLYEHLRAHPVTLLKRGGGRREIENYRGYGEFIGSVLIVVIGWLPLFAFGEFMKQSANHHARVYERERKN